MDSLIIRVIRAKSGPSTSRVRLKVSANFDMNYKHSSVGKEAQVTETQDIFRV